MSILCLHCGAGLKPRNNSAAILLGFCRSGCCTGEKMVCTLVSPLLQKGQSGKATKERDNVILYNIAFVLYRFLDRDLGNAFPASALRIPKCL
jgi:hypothetical protein